MYRITIEKVSEKEEERYQMTRSYEDIYQQTVETLDIQAVIAVVNEPNPLLIVKGSNS